jgi:uroporphyrinogen III methyltransferase / synthase
MAGKSDFFKNKKILLPQSEIADDSIFELLKKFGADVSRVSIYKNVFPKLDWEIQAIERTGADIVTFTSSSTATNFFNLTRSKKFFSAQTRRNLNQCKFVTIGPSTSLTLSKLGLKVFAEGKPHTIDGLVDSLVKAVRK